LLSVNLTSVSGAQARRLLVQCDNAAGENKNKFIFGVLSLFVLLGWFDVVELHMLLKGHTHDIADAAFGNFHELIFNTGTKLCVRLCKLVVLLRFCVYDWRRGGCC
jgi:hypothetical protein